MNPADVSVRLIEHASSRGWGGHDPYDTLLSGVGRVIAPLGGLPRFALSQLSLRVPFVRRAIAPPPSINAKGLALFLGAATRARATLGDPKAGSIAYELITELERRAVNAGCGVAWGYPFPWQSRSFWAPAGTPNAVVTATAGWQLLEAAEAFGDDRALALGLSAARALATHFKWTGMGNHARALSYTAHDRTRVVNISALASRLLRRAGRTDPAMEMFTAKLTRFVCDSQRSDGSWPYAIERGGDWEDSFHTGYVLESLLSLRDAGVDVPDATLVRGFEAYHRFFGADGSARLASDTRSPFDAHSAAQGIITWCALDASPTAPSQLKANALAESRRIAEWSLRVLWLPDEGHFAYRGRGTQLDSRNFSRWVQAWMALAMATLAARETNRTTASMVTEVA